MAGYVTSAAGLESYKRMFTLARDNSQTERENASKYRRYYDGKIDAKLQKALRRKKIPDFTSNNVRLGVEGYVGVVDRGQADPRALPRTPQDEGAAEIATDTLRYIADTSRWKPLKVAGFRNMLIEGTTAVIVDVTDEMDVELRRVRAEEFFADPFSRELDFSDASFMGFGKWMYVDQVVAVYPEHEAALRLSASYTEPNALWEDRPSHVTWNDPVRKRLFVVEMYHRTSGAWTKCVFTGSVTLEEGESPYLDNKGRPCCPIEAVSAYIDDDNVRYGVVADMVGPQDEINFYRRRAANSSMFRQVQESDPVAAYADPEEVRREAARHDGVIPPGYNIVPNEKFQIDMALMAEAKSAIERTQVSEGILGRQSADASGRSMLVRQQAGLTEQSHLLTAVEDWEQRIYRQAWARARQFWTGPKFIRVTDKADALKFLQINEPVMGPEVPIYDQATGQWSFQAQQIGVRNAIAQMDVDIIVDSTPDTANVQQEQFSELVELRKAGVAISDRAIILASTLRNKREILEEMKTPPPAPPPAVAERMAAETDKLKAQADQSRATAARTMAEIPPPAPPPQAAYPAGY